ncbi:hypothetical protein LG3211_0232 [Lysobacter gummosus]|nr:hypothetical protein LG3211_0232 [Lysobacter gummosus]
MRSVLRGRRAARRQVRFDEDFSSRDSRRDCRHGHDENDPSPTAAARTHAATRCISTAAEATRAPSSRLSRKPSFAMLE